MANKSKACIQWPWFILFFCLAAVANTYVHILQALYPSLKHLGVIGLTVTLFLIGTGLSKKTLQEVGARPLLQGILLWIAPNSRIAAVKRQLGVLADCNR